MLCKNKNRILRIIFIIGFYFSIARNVVCNFALKFDWRHGMNDPRCIKEDVCDMAVCDGIESCVVRCAGRLPNVLAAAFMLPYCCILYLF